MKPNLPTEDDSPFPPSRISGSGLRFFALLTILAVAFVVAPLKAGDPETGEAALDRAQELIYSETGSEEEIEQLLKSAESAFEKVEDTARRACGIGRVYLLRGTFLNAREKSRRAASALREAIARAEEAVEREEFSEGYRLLADAHSQMMMARGILYMARHGDTARSAAFKSLELDPENPRAHISVAGYYLNAPSIAGGDPSKGVEILRRGVSLGNAAESERFLMYLWLAEAHQDLGKSGEAREYLEEAREIFPRSPQLSELAARISG
ncbi:MAG: tetratricopeptide repeat protein [Alkalispirochaetaceae bacterium]